MGPGGPRSPRGPPAPCFPGSPCAGHNHAGQDPGVVLGRPQVGSRMLALSDSIGTRKANLQKIQADRGNLSLPSVRADRQYHAVQQYPEVRGYRRNPAGDKRRERRRRRKMEKKKKVRRRNTRWWRQEHCVLNSNSRPPLGVNLQQGRQHLGYPSRQQVQGLQQRPSRQCDRKIRSHHGFLWVLPCQRVRQVRRVQSYPAGVTGGGRKCCCQRPPARCAPSDCADAMRSETYSGAGRSNSANASGEASSTLRRHGSVSRL